MEELILAGGRCYICQLVWDKPCGAKVVIFHIVQHAFIRLSSVCWFAIHARYRCLIGDNAFKRCVLLCAIMVLWAASGFAAPGECAWKMNRYRLPAGNLRCVN